MSLGVILLKARSKIKGRSKGNIAKRKKQIMKVAILDLYDGTENLGMQSLINIITRYDELTYKVYDVRGKCQVPSMEYDIYISSGGPGSPLEGDGVWDRAYYFFLDKLWNHNQRSEDKKFAFFICHSFQMICHHLSLGDVVIRHRPSTGILPVHKTAAGMIEPVFTNVPEPFYAGDFRHWQVIQPNHERLANLGCEILAIEQEQPTDEYERALMAIRFSNEWIGTQFHPEANPSGMLKHLSIAEKRNEIIEQEGHGHFMSMVEYAKDPGKLKVTFDAIIPTFLEQSIEALLAIEEYNLV